MMRSKPRDLFPHDRLDDQFSDEMRQLIDHGEPIGLDEIGAAGPAKRTNRVERLSRRADLRLVWVSTAAAAAVIVAGVGVFNARLAQDTRLATVMTPTEVASGAGPASDPTRPEVLGACYPKASDSPAESVGLVFSDRLLSGSSNWLTVSRLDAQSEEISSVHEASGKTIPVMNATAVDAKDLSGTAATRSSAGIGLQDRDLARISSAVGRDREFIVQVYSRPDGKNEGSIVAMASADGSISFIGNCAFDNLTRPFNAFLAYLVTQGDKRSGKELLTDLVRNPQGDLAKRLVSWAAGDRKPPLWTSLDPSQRMIRPGWTPDGVMNSLAEVDLYVTVPNDWLQSKQNLCTKSSVAWSGTCNRLSPGREAQQPFLVRAYVPAGEAIELVLQNGNDLTSPYITLGFIKPSEFGPNRRVQVHLSGDHKTAADITLTPTPDNSGPPPIATTNTTASP